MAHITWKRSEIETIINNYATKTTEELSRMLPGRSKKAINRKIEALRDEGVVGHRTDDTIKRAYFQRKPGEGKKIGRPSRKRRRLPIPDDYEEVDG